jgi:hypothetical protein
MEDLLTYSMRRASEEAVRARESRGKAQQAHLELSELHAARAREIFDALDEWAASDG